MTISMTPPRELAEVFPVSATILDEMFERDWTRNEVARRMGGDFATQCLTLDLIVGQRDFDDDTASGLLLGEKTAIDLERAFGISAEYWLRTDEAYRQWRATRQATPREPGTWLRVDTLTDAELNDIVRHVIGPDCGAVYPRERASLREVLAALATSGEGEP